MARLALSSLRELVLLAAGIAALAVGLAARPRDPATIGIGVSLLVATPASAASRNNGTASSDSGPPGTGTSA